MPALFLLLGCSQAKAQTCRGKCTRGFSGTDIACVAEAVPSGRTTLPRATCLKCEGQEHLCLCLCPLLPATRSHRHKKGHPHSRMAAMHGDIPGNEWLLIAAAHFSVWGFSTVKSLRLNASLCPGTRNPGTQVSGRIQQGSGTAKEKAFHLFPRS